MTLEWERFFFIKFLKLYFSFCNFNSFCLHFSSSLMELCEIIIHKQLYTI